MKSHLFRRYVWLIDVIRHADGITFEEISEMWLHSAMNPKRKPLPLRTFHNHRIAVGNLFGIKILCNRKNHNQYYIGQDESTNLKIWMLQTLSVSGLEVKNTDPIVSRIVIDKKPDGQLDVSAIVDSMKRRQRLRVVYSIPASDDHRTEFEIEPHCVRCWNRVWYLLGKDVNTGKMVVFDISRILSLAETGEDFEYDEDFIPVDFFKNYYGMEIDLAETPTDIRIKVSGKTRDKIRTQPIHTSQKEIMAGYDSSIFEYFFVPSGDFKRTILSMGEEAEIVHPVSLREEMGNRVRRMAEQYAAQ